VPDEENDATYIALGKLAKKLATNPKTRKLYVSAVKEVEPNLRFPDIEMDEFRSEMNARLEQEKLERENARILAQQEAEKLRVLERYTPEQVADMEKTVMEKHGLSSYELAAKIYGADLKPATPANAPSPHGTTWDMPTDKELLKDPARWARKAAQQAIDELNQRRR
jgi:hypothetical protein